MSRLRVLLVDDDAGFLRRFQLHGETLFAVAATGSAGRAFKLLAEQSFDAALLDVNLGGGKDGIELLRGVRKRWPDLPVVMVSADERVETVVEAMREGAIDYVSKRPNLELLHAKVQAALDGVAWRVHAREMQNAGWKLIGSSATTRELQDEIERVAVTRVPVLILGESGTGKELVASAIHAASPRSAERLVVMGGAVGTDDLFDSELFGHERGAFTGADQRRIGRLELAHGGTLFLDEVGRLTPARQAKLLRVIETGRHERLGGQEEIRSDVRWITATNEELEKKIREGGFLHDLFHRINVYSLRVPPLRDRLEDLPDLVGALLQRFAEAEGLAIPRPADEALVPLRTHDWPGNVRELDTVLKRAAILAGDRSLTEDDFQTALDGHLRGSAAAPLATPDPGRPDRALDPFLEGEYRQARQLLLETFDRRYVERALRRHGGNVTRASREMGISRATLHRLMKELGVASSTQQD